MANNHVSSLLNVDFPKPKHSNFNLGRGNFISADVGYIYPVYVEEVLPNSKKRLDVRALVQTNATVAPVMSSFTCKLEAFFIPTRIYYRHLMDNDRAINFDEDFDFHYFPWLDVGSETDYSFNGAHNLSVQSTSLLEYLGMFPAGWRASVWQPGSGSGYRINAIPFIGYFDIYRNYYANPQDPYVPFRVTNFIEDLGNLEDFPQSQDMHVSLDKFDRFIQDIRDDSIGSAGTPNGVDVLKVFTDRMTGNVLPTSSSQFYRMSVPLFRNSTGYAGQVDPGFTSNAMHYGLLRSTYKDDYFNSRFQTQFIEYLDNQAFVEVQNGRFGISQLRMQNRLAKYIDRSIFSDTRFGSWLKAHFGVKLNDRLDIPQFLGSMSWSLDFNDIVSTSQTGNSDVVTSNESLGSRAGLGSAFAESKGSFVDFFAKEPGYLMVNFRIIPNVSYTQGIRKMYLKNRFSDVFTPEFDAVGYQDLHRLELDALGSNPVSIEPNSSGLISVSAFNTVVGKHPAWMEYMTSYDESHGLMQDRLQYGFWTLNRPFAPSAYFSEPRITQNVNKLVDSTYIYPELFNTIFAVDQLTDNFQCRFRFFDKTKQPISKQIMPHL